MYITNIFHLQTKQKDLNYPCITVNFIINLFITASLTFLWNIYTTLQITFVLLSPIQLRIANKVENGTYEHICYFIIDLFITASLTFHESHWTSIPYLTELFFLKLVS